MPRSARREVDAAIVEPHCGPGTALSHIPNSGFESSENTEPNFGTKTQSKTNFGSAGDRSIHIADCEPSVGDYVTESRSSTHASESGSECQKMTTSGKNKNNAAGEMMPSALETFLMKQTELMQQMMVNMSHVPKISQPTATITRPLDENENNSYSIALSEESQGNSDEEPDADWTNELDKIADPAAIEDDIIEEKDSDDLLSSMELFYKQEEKCSGKIEDRLAKIVNDSMRTRIGETKKKDLLAKHMKPQNCEKITVPRINKGIWSSLPRKARDQDLKLQHIQSTMCKTFYPLIHLMDKLLKAQTGKQGLALTEVTDCFALCNDTFKLLQLGFSEMSQRRRLSLRPELSNEYKALCAAEIPVTDHLFGDELEKQIKEITDAKKVSRKITDKHNQSQRYSPMYSNFKNRYTQNRQNSFKSPSYGRHTMNRNNTTKSSFLEKRQFQKFQRNKKE